MPLLTTLALLVLPLQPPPPAKPDVAFMQGMIAHHAQALTMSALVPARTQRPELLALAERIVVSQQDEIAIMQSWLRERKQTVPEVSDAAHAGHHAPAHSTHDMPGMLTSTQMDSLSAATGVQFERLFLRYMIQHHDGALQMVASLLSAPGGARDPQVFQFASDVDTDQRAEIRRMRALLDRLPSSTP
jgi:uncharacterized protein (DUF305 family)